MKPASESLGDLVKSAFFIFLGAISGHALAFIAQIVIIRSLDPALFGEISLSYTIVVSASTLALLGLHDGVTRRLSEEGESSYPPERILQSGLWLVLLTGSAFAIILYLLRDWIGEFVQIPAIPGFLVLFLPFLIFHPLARVMFGALRAKEQSFPAVLSRDIVPRVSGLALLAILLYVGEAALGAVFYWVSAPLFLLASAAAFVRRDLSLNSVVSSLPDPELTKDLWQFSWPLAGGLAVFLFLRNLDILMIGYFLDQTEVGYYRSIQPLQQIATIVLGSFTFIFLPRATRYFDRGELDELEKFYTSSTKWILLATAPPVLLFAFFAPDIIQIAFGGEYVPASTALSILVGGLLLRSVTGLNGDLVRAIDKTRIELYSALVGLTSNFALNVALIPRFGIEGAAFATVIGYTVYNVIQTSAIYRETGITPFALDNVKPLVISIPVAWILSVFVGGDIGTLGILVIGLSLGLVQLMALILTRSVNDSDLGLLSDIETYLDRDLNRVRTFLQKWD